MSMLSPLNSSWPSVLLPFWLGRELPDSVASKRSKKLLALSQSSASISRPTLLLRVLSHPTSIALFLTSEACFPLSPSSSVSGPALITPASSRPLIWRLRRTSTECRSLRYVSVADVNASRRPAAVDSGGELMAVRVLTARPADSRSFVML